MHVVKKESTMWLWISSLSLMIVYRIMEDYLKIEKIGEGLCFIFQHFPHFWMEVKKRDKKWMWCELSTLFVFNVTIKTPPHLNDLRSPLFSQVPMEWYTRAGTRPRARWWPWKRSVWKVKRKACPARPSERSRCCRSSNIPMLSGELGKWREGRFLN